MSWKATAFVKKLRDVTRSEKLLLMVLADYHNNAKRAAWPSVKTLAEDCLMSERTVERMLARLEGRFLLRCKGNGRGNVSAYQFIGLDTIKGEKIPPFSEQGRATQRATLGPRKGDIPPCVIRNEQVNRSLEPGNVEEEITKIYSQPCDFFNERKKAWAKKAGRA